MVDTIVMANLGYFQLKANPGSWDLLLRDGRSSEIYSVTSHSNTESQPGEEPVRVVLDSFAGKSIRVKVAKRPGKENEKLLGEASDEGQGPGILASISE
jgi:UDP-glucose:glycoprotein glucosyltransferase